MTEKYNDRVCNSETPTRFIKQRVSDVAPILEADDNSAPEKIKKVKPTLLTSAMAGGVAGVVVDITLYPLDTIKTRLQSPNGFKASGGFKGVYKGVIPVLLCSAPISALFFAVYNTMINTLSSKNQYLNPFVYLASASVAEIVGSILRVPLEVVKQRKQTTNKKSIYIINQTYKTEGFFGFYRGFWSTLGRELPFAVIQYPLWEIMIHQFIIYQSGKELTAFQTACCGALAGGIAGTLTTPMDVVKTRIMLEEKKKIDEFKKNLNYNFAKDVYRQKGIVGLFAGVVPRFLWITLGGFIYFGTYEKTKLLLEERCKYFSRGFEKAREVAPTYIEGKLESLIFSKNGWCDIDFKKQPELEQQQPRVTIEQENKYENKEKENLSDGSITVNEEETTSEI